MQTSLWSHESVSINLTTSMIKEPKGELLTNPAKIAESFKDIRKLDKETFYVVTLTQKHQEIDRHLVSIGTLTASLVHPREVYKPAILDSAAAVVFVHNHPSGDVTPSREDKALTKRLVDAGALLGIRVLDHIIIGNGALSFAEEGLMPSAEKEKANAG